MAARVVRGVIEGGLVLIILLLLVAVWRQMAVVGWAVMGHDNEYFYGISRQVSAGAIPYRDFDFEYPPLALLPIVIPYLAWPGDVSGYSLFLAVENVGVVAATAGCLVYLARRGWSIHGTAGTLVLYALLVAATPILFWRFDSVPALLTVLAVCAVASERPGMAGLTLGLGGLVKLYPFILLPVLGLRSLLSRRWRALSWMFGAAATFAGLGLIALVASAGADGLSFLGYHAERGVQIESVPASIALVAYLAGGPAVRPFVGFGSWQLESSFVDSLGWLWIAVLALMAGALAISALGRYLDEMPRIGSVRPETQISLLLAAVLLLVLAYRVLSPQFLVWLLPLAALLPRGKVMVLVAACAFTLYLYPFGYDGLVDLQAPAILTLALRNLLLLGLFVWLVAPGVIRGASRALHRAQAVLPRDSS